MKIFDRTSKRTVLLGLSLVLLISAIGLPSLSAQTDADFDEYKVRIDAFWFYSNPTGSFQDATTGNIINLHKDFGFGSYSTFTRKLDWKFTRKNHVYLVGTPFDQSRQAVPSGRLSFRARHLTSACSRKPT